ncbi:hypothetical protein MXB_3891 [Myxobolus squamalis]|nr:hypothetical protein MXB_3891 [Myxobolus squamalis]
MIMMDPSMNFYVIFEYFLATSRYKYIYCSLLHEMNVLLNYKGVVRLGRYQKTDNQNVDGSWYSLKNVMEPYLKKIDSTTIFCKREIQRYGQANQILVYLNAKQD